jgi:hypothetical protein
MVSFALLVPSISQPSLHYKKLFLTAPSISGRAGLADGTTSYPKFLGRILQYTRLPLLIAVVLIIVAGSILNLSFLKAGASVITATFIYLCGIAVFISTTRLRNQLNANAQRSLWIALASLPLYTVRVIYLMLVEFGNVRFDPVIGDWRYLASLGFAMEVGIAVLLVMAGIAVEPW